MPFLLPKGFLNSTEDLYISQGHAIKVEGKFKLPEHLRLKRLSIEEFLQLNADKYYHIELYCEEGEDRRSNTLDANGVIVESYSSDEIPW
uniref:Hedgehog/Intein (Hint) domain-containing protein n=1 Tax=viral metagenome TaxID=1070528 RepID=A0A6C0ADI0_9ZZZZ